MNPLDRPGITERLATASLSRNLTVIPDRRGDVDYIIALGAAQLREQGRFGSNLARVSMIRTRTALLRALESVRGLVAHLSTKRRWRLTEDEIRAVAKHALMHHVLPTCQACHGRAFEVQPGTQRLSGRACSACGGTGRRPVQRKHRTEIEHTIAHLETIEAITETAVANLLR